MRRCRLCLCRRPLLRTSIWVDATGVPEFDCIGMHSEAFQDGLDSSPTQRRIAHTANLDQLFVFHRCPHCGHV